MDNLARFEPLLGGGNVAPRPNARNRGCAAGFNFDQPPFGEFDTKVLGQRNGGNGPNFDKDSLNLKLVFSFVGIVKFDFFDGIFAKNLGDAGT